MALRVVPLDRDEAHAFIARHHRHHRLLVGEKFALGLVDDDGELRGVATVGRPVARRLDVRSLVDRQAEITRVATDGTPNACSMLYGASRRTALAMGYAHVFTYTLPEEGGASLRAAGFRLARAAGGSAAMWRNRPGRKAQPVGDDLIGGKWLWVSP